MSLRTNKKQGGRGDVMLTAAVSCCLLLALLSSSKHTNAKTINKSINDIYFSFLFFIDNFQSLKDFLHIMHNIARACTALTSLCNFNTFNIFAGP